MKKTTENNQLINKTLEKLSSGTGKILVIQTAFLGDVILVTPLLRSIRNTFPNSQLSVVVIPQCTDVLQSQADQIIVFDKRNRSMIKEKWNELVNKIRYEKFDVAFIPHRSLRSGLTAYKAGIPCRIGFKRGAGSFYHTHKVRYRFNEYEGNRNLRLIELLTKHSYNGLPELFPTHQNEETADKILDRLGLVSNEFIVFAPGSVWTSKRWLIKHYQELSARFEKEYSLQVLTIGGGEDREICASVVSRPERNLAGELSPLGSAAIVARARFFISGDSAPAHIATAMGTRQVIIFGSTSPRFGFVPPVSTARIIQTKLWCRPCSNHGRNYCINWGSYKCLKMVTPDFVIDAVNDWV
ncbi:MAG: glycosyltransferase family 9 protein [Candidatus Hatepunaea meridiana]|nr:glycosyltransferase family 9 protein [Candidatus Hatepunaea meridiana]